MTTTYEVPLSPVRKVPPDDPVSVAAEIMIEIYGSQALTWAARMAAHSSTDFASAVQEHVERQLSGS